LKIIFQTIVQTITKVICFYFRAEYGEKTVQKLNSKIYVSNISSNNYYFLFQSRIRREDGPEVEPAHRFDHQRPGGRTMQDSERQRPARRDLRTFCQPVLKSEIRQFIEKSSNLLKTFQILWH
jgi:hypothetical protein